MKKWFSYFLGLIGIIGIWIFIDHLVGFSNHDYFYIQNPGIEKYVGTNVVSMWADFSFFTYHTLIFFSVWCILQFIGNILNLKKLNNFLFRKDVLAFITTNYIITAVCYTIFELSTGKPTFGLYANVPKAWHSFGTNILVHYIIFAISIINYIHIKPSNVVNKKSYIIISLYLIIYYIAVKLAGMYCYQIIWYPYPIFDSEALWALLGFESYNSVFSILLLIIINTLIYLLYFIIFNLLLSVKGRKNTGA